MLKQLFRRHSPEGILDAARTLRSELKIARRHRKGLQQARKFASRSGLKVNFGCGPHMKSGWVNIDLEDSADVQLDLRRELPLRDASCRITYSEHFFEHLEYPGQAMHFLRECHCILEPGGTFSVGVPDTALYMFAYAAGTTELFDTAKRIWHPAWCQTRMEHINYHFPRAQSIALPTMSRRSQPPS